jgi:cytochrome c oxidase subunit 4
MMMASHESHDHPLVPVHLYLIVWAALVTLTGVTVGVSYLNLGHVAILTAVLIAAAKATLVLLYFMHVRFDHPAIAAMILVVIASYGVFFGLTFSDYLFR